MVRDVTPLRDVLLHQFLAVRPRLPSELGPFAPGFSLLDAHVESRASPQSTLDAAVIKQTMADADHCFLKKQLKEAAVGYRRALGLIALLGTGGTDTQRVGSTDEL